MDVPFTPRSRGRRRGAVAALIALAALAVAGCTPAWELSPPRGLQPLIQGTVPSVTSDQGPATVRPPGGQPYEAYGGEIIPSAQSTQGWSHVGDPDSLDGYTVYPYQASDPAKGKMYLVVTPSGRSYEYVHPLSSGEEYNNSFAAVSPDGRWLVSGEWDTMSRLLVFKMPVLNPAVPAGGGQLQLAGTITLGTPMTDVQGCDFVDSSRLICSSDDATKELFDLRLSNPLGTGADPAATTASVTSMGALPRISTCTGTFEAEGLDYDPVSRFVRVEVIPPAPCFLSTDLYVYRLTT